MYACTIYMHVHKLKYHMHVHNTVIHAHAHVHTWQAAASKLVVFKNTLTLWSDEVPLGELAISMECVNCIKGFHNCKVIFTIGTPAFH
jgi:hypothetical protein